MSGTRKNNERRRDRDDASRRSIPLPEQSFFGAWFIADRGRRRVEQQHNTRRGPGAAQVAADPNEDYAQALLAGLSAPQKSIPSRFLYDAAGSALFERITTLPEYYPTRTETDILKQHAAEIAAMVPDGAVLIEFGSGSSTKTELLLEQMRGLHAYVPIDISPAALRDAKARIVSRFPQLHVLPIEADFGQPIDLPLELAARPLIGFFPGSTIGNLRYHDAVALLASMRRTLGRQAQIIVGADLKKNVHRLIAAYDDAAGVTAAFNLNLLVRANRELGGDFDLDRFAHAATYDMRNGRIDMHLVSQREQWVSVCGRRFHFDVGERIHTEHSHKYDIDGFHAMVAAAGWRPTVVWVDPERLFSVHVLSGAE